MITWTAPVLHKSTLDNLNQIIKQVGGNWSIRSLVVELLDMCMCYQLNEN